MYLRPPTMLATRDSYTRRLLRMKTLGADFNIARNSAEEKPGCAGATASASGERPGARLPSAAGGRHGPSSSQLWMRKPPQHRRRPRRGAPQPKPSWQPLPPQPQSLPSSNCPTAGTDLETRTCLDRQSSLLDTQTNNSRRGSGPEAGGFGRRGGVTTSVNNASTARGQELDEEDDEFDDYEDAESSDDLYSRELQNSNTEGLDLEALNENAVAKGANALVKQTTSRQTEIIDTSKLLEEGKVETQYEEPEDEPEEIEETDYKLIDEYEKTFAYARRLRALLNMKFKVAERGSIETNFLLVKAHEHPTQKVIDRWRNVDLGNPYDNQIRQKKLIDDFKQTCNQKKQKKGDTQVPIFPEWIKFYVRFKKDVSEKRWNDFTAYKQKMKKLTGGKVSVPKANDKYLPAFYDVWSASVVAFAKPETTLLDVIDPVFAKLGLEARADFKFTIGCFVGDKRAGKAKIPGAPSEAEEVTMQVICAELYKRNCSEIFVNDNRVEMFQEFPAFYSGPGFINPLGDEGDKKADKKKGKKAKKAKNQSNREVSDDRLLVSLVTRGPDGLGGSSRRSAAGRSMGDTLVTKLSIAEEAGEFDKRSSSGINRKISIQDCGISDQFETDPTIEGQCTTTKSGRTDT